jgi:cytosine/adenosine deaminase-related metal-dependent hydrolase
MPAPTLNRRRLLASASLLPLTADLQSQTSLATLFTHATIVTPTVVLEDAALAIQADRISAIGPTPQLLAQFPSAQIIEARGKALLPGLINCHAHLEATIARGFNEDFGFPNSARLSVQPASLLSKEEATLMAAIGAQEAIRSGTTTLVQNAAGIGNAASTLAQTGLRFVFAESASDRENSTGPVTPAQAAANQPPRYSARLRDEGLQRIEDLYSAWHGKNQGRISVFPSAALAENSSPELLHAVRAFAEKHSLSYTTHLNQSQAEIDFFRKFHGVRPAGFLQKHDYLGPRLFAAHCRYVDDSEIALLGRSRTVVSHQAAMAANRGVIPPIPALRAAGCPIAYGTDNNTNDMFEVMRVALLTERIRRNDSNPGTRPQPEDMLEDATRGGAHALGMAQLTGTLEPGKKADLIVLDTQRPHLLPAGRIVSAWIHNGQPSDIEAVMVDGQFLMRDRKVLTMDEPRLVADASRVGRRVWNQVLSGGPIPLPGRGTGN